MSQDTEEKRTRTRSKGIRGKHSSLYVTWYGKPKTYLRSVWPIYVKPACYYMCNVIYVRDVIYANVLVIKHNKCLFSFFFLVPLELVGQEYRCVLFYNSCFYCYSIPIFRQLLTRPKHFSILLVVRLQDVMVWVMSVENMLDTEGTIKWNVKL